MGSDYFQSHQFRYLRKKWTIYQRAEGGSWSIRIQIEGRRKARSLKTSNRSYAKDAAKVLIDKSQKKGGISAPKITTLVQIIDFYKENHPWTQDKQAQRNIARMKLVAGSNWETMPLKSLNAKVARDFQARKQGRDSPSYKIISPGATAANSDLRSAQAIFGKKYLTLYREAGFEIPDSITKGFKEVPPLKEPSHKYSDNPIPDEAIQAMNAALPSLKAQDERLWAIHMMIRLMGLRDSEIHRARKSWIVGNRLTIRATEGEDAPKAGDGGITIPPKLLEWFQRQEGEFLIPAKSKTERIRLVERVHSKWVRKFLPDRTKTNHELRKWSGSMVAQKTNSFERAAEFLRISLKTASDHYLAFIDPMNPLDFNDL